MKLAKSLIRSGILLFLVAVLAGCPVVNTALTNPRVLDPKYNFSKVDLERYNQWVRETLNESSRHGTSAIIVNKSAYRLYLIMDGTVNSSYPVDLGFNAIDDKLIEGDGCTPEGMYFVQRKLGSGQTAFHKAFLINYPSRQDRKLGKTGGLIEIHGSGTGLTKLQGGYNWTWGCVAVSDEDMDTLFNHINERDRITIVRYTNETLPYD